MPDHDPPHAGIESNEPTPGPLLLLATVMVVCPALIKALSPAVTLPAWDLDPMLFPNSVAGCTPWVSLLLDSVTLLGSALSLYVTRAIQSESSARKTLLVVAALLVGAGPIVYHGWLSPFATIGQQRIGLSWIAAIAGGLAVARLGSIRALRSLMVAVLVGFVGYLLAKGAIQIFVEHKQTVDDYLANKEARLAALGWSVDSPMARAFERRIMQREASGWFGLSNVFGSLGAALACVGAGLTAASITLGRETRDASRDEEPSQSPSLAIPVLTILAACACVGMAASKGATVAGLLGLGLFGAIWTIRGRALTGALGLIGPLACVGALAAVMARGLIGERLGELSLLFRWFYIQAATRIFVDHSLLGVGPDGFKDAYLLAKNPLSPEEVQSPHSVFFDWLACLGAPGVAWIALVLVVLTVIVRRAATPQPRPSTETVRHASGGGLVRPALLAVLAASFTALFLQRQELVPADALARVGGLVVWAVLAAGLAKQSRVLLHPLARAGMAAGAVALATHAQIEMTGTWIQSCGFAGLFVGLAAAGEIPQRRSPKGAPATPPVGVPKWLAGASVLPLCVLAVAGIIWGVLPAHRWQTDLESAADGLRPIAEAQQFLRVAQALPPLEAAAQARETAGELAVILGRPVPSIGSAQDLGALLSAAQPIAADRAARTLASQTVSGSFDPRIVREIIRLTPLTPSAETSLFQGALPPGCAAAQVLGDPRAGDAAPWRAGLNATKASIFEFVFRTSLQQAAAGAKPALAAGEAAIAVQTLARTADPQNLDLAFRLLALCDDFSKLSTPDGPTAAQAAAAASIAPLAREVLTLNANNRLDPLRQLGDAARLRAVRLAGDSK